MSGLPCRKILSLDCFSSDVSNLLRSGCRDLLLEFSVGLFYSTHGQDINVFWSEDLKVRFERHRLRSKGIGCEDLDWINLAQDRVRWQTFYSHFGLWFIERLLIDQVICRIIEWLVNVVLERMWKEAVVDKLMVLSRHCLEGLRENLNSDNRSLGLPNTKQVC
jgi:hypothetical protein